jgi:23S rRNA pseudouridine1911/1915/1917 synthase
VIVPAALEGVRVDRAVALLCDVPRARARAAVAAGGVRVDGTVVTTPSRALRAGADLEVVLPALPDGPAPEPGVALAVVYEDDQVVVVDKPAGLVVHPGAGRDTGTMVGGLLARYPDLAGLVEAGLCPPDRPGVVHRLDQGTSGLLVVARTPDAYRALVAQFGSREVGRRYLAMVAGAVADQAGVVDAPIGRSARVPTRMAVARDGREARTAYQVLARVEGEEPLTALALRLETGRTHQIRVHLAAIGHPVLGDARYAGSAGPARTALALQGTVARGLPEGRLFLHAATLAFDHPGDGTRRSFESPLPDELARAWPG